MSNTSTKDTVREKYGQAGKAYGLDMTDEMLALARSNAATAGATEETQFKRLLTQAGFTNIDIDPTRVYHIDDARTFLSCLISTLV